MSKNKKQDKNNKNKDNKSMYILTTIISIVLVGILVFSYFYIENKNKEIELAYTDLIKQIDDKKIEEIEMTSGSTTAKIKYKGKDEEKDKKIVSIPDTEAFTELIQTKVQNGNDIKLIQKQEKEK